MDFKIKRASENELEGVARFYNGNGYSHGDLSNDHVYIAKSANDELLGVGRLCDEENILVLRGMQVRNNSQKKGIGRAILKSLDQAIGPRECFTLPWDHLECFYGSIGFCKIDSALAPSHLKDRSEDYYRRFKNIIAMHRPRREVSISYSANKKISPAQVIEVFKSSGIKRPVNDVDRIKRMLEGANLTVTAWDGDTLVGIGRALTDYSYCCYVSDLAVMIGYQKLGIGKEILEQLRSLSGEECVLFLRSASNAISYYPHIGLLPFDNCFHLPRKK